MHEDSTAENPRIYHYTSMSRRKNTGKMAAKRRHAREVASEPLVGAALVTFKSNDDIHVNVGTGIDLSIRELAEKIRDLVYPEAELQFDLSKPDGTPRKVLDVSRLAATGWKPKIDLDTGMRETYEWFLAQEAAHAEMRGIDRLAASTR